MHKKYTWFSDKVEVRRSKLAGQGLFALSNINKDEVISVKGGHVIQQSTFDALTEGCQKASLQISENMYIVPLTDLEIPEVMVYINHSCSPNVGLHGHLETVAMRNILKGEELTGDYSMAYSHTNEVFGFKCSCLEPNCRVIITSSDWKRYDLQKKYKGYFSAYINQLIIEQHNN